MANDGGITAEELLKNETEAKNLIYNPIIDKYVGFMNLYNITIKCEVMASNRIINQNVINVRVKENEEHFKKTGNLLDFGSAILVVIRANNNDAFYVADGQHRISTLFKLKELGVTSELWIAVTVKMVNTEREAKEYLKLFQKQYPPDIRLFSENLQERESKNNIINMFRNLWPAAFTVYDKREIDKINSACFQNHRVEVERPHLSDGLVCNLYRDIDILRSNMVSNELLDEMNRFIIETANEKLDRLKKVDGCCFGIVRETDVKILRAINNKFSINSN